MNELMIFSNEEFGEVRTVEINGKPYFMALDIARALGYSRPADAISAHCKGSVKHRVLTNGGEQEAKFIPEGDIYRLLIKSQMPDAPRFESWVFDEVLPEIRKTGKYEGKQPPKTYLEALEALVEAEKEKQKMAIEMVAMSEKIEEMQPKITYLDKILESKDTMLVTQIAQDYGMSARGFNKMLHDLCVQHKVGGQWILYSKYQGNGYVHSHTHKYEKEDGRTGTRENTEWTQKGRLFLYNFLKEHNKLPLIEQE